MSKKFNYEMCMKRQCDECRQKDKCFKERGEYKMERIIKEGKVLRSFNDKKNNLKAYAKGDTFRAEDTRYFELFRQGFLSEGKAVTSKNSK